MQSYILASSKIWNIEAFVKYRRKLVGRWVTISDPDDLTLELIDNIKPRYVFFMHWSSIIRQEILNAAECVCFHMTDLPYGQGGSPLQNLIATGHTDTKVTVFRMTDKLDAGPIYMKAPMSLHGSAAEIFRRCAFLSLGMMERLTQEEPIPIEQSGVPVIFRRRTPRESLLPPEGDLTCVYDHIRMLDAESYPPAFIDYGDYRMTFSTAKLDPGLDAVTAETRISIRPKAKSEGIPDGSP